MWDASQEPVGSSRHVVPLVSCRVVSCLVMAYHVIHAHASHTGVFVNNCVGFANQK